MAASSSTCPSLPASFYSDFGITSVVFDSAFDYVGDGLFKLKPGWSLAFTHAVLTTGDRATTVTTPTQTGSAGELWNKCTGHSVTTERCCVFNCPNPNCKPGNRQPALATAHVYCTTQTPQHDIRFMILIPTCSCCNHAGQAAKSGTIYPATGQDAYILYTETGARMIFVTVSTQTLASKGTGKGGTYGQGQGGGYHGDYPPGPPPGAKNVVGK